jgi:gliding motility-associated-like protein
VRVVDVPNVTIVAPGGIRSDTTIRFGNEINLQGHGANTYEWYPNYQISSTDGDEVTVKPFRNTQYIVTGYNSKGCASNDTINVIVIEDCGEMFVPNAFSPNGSGDARNEQLRVEGICLETLTFMIFDRWGEKIFETRNQAIGWDGTYKGEKCNTGVYVYRLEGKTYDGKAYSLKGNVTLVR